jgi:hypothetical protein
VQRGSEGWVEFIRGFYMKLPFIEPQVDLSRPVVPEIIMNTPYGAPQVDWLLCHDSPLSPLKKHWIFQLGMLFRTRHPTVVLLTAWKQNQQGWPAASTGGSVMVTITW